ncbi:hypothetical protein ACQ86N_33830 [Puia sp. P3]|uniref:hypothetical protein n=1 Tax=Puia sp. P3 TaxID=3423952 RepID=UPI003D67CD81
MTMGNGRKYTVRTVIFYAVYCVAAWVLERVAPSGPCTPGLGVMVLIFTPMVGLALFLFSLIGRIVGRRDFVGPMLVNAGVVVLSLCIFFGLR